jgi:hypothetical protein
LLQGQKNKLQMYRINCKKLIMDIHIKLKESFQIVFQTPYIQKIVIKMDFNCHQMAKTSWGHSSYHTVIEINFSHFEISLGLTMAIEINFRPVEVGLRLKMAFEINFDHLEISLVFKMVTQINFNCFKVYLGFRMAININLVTIGFG